MHVHTRELDESGGLRVVSIAASYRGARPYVRSRAIAV